jgi:hypothetical protein
MRGLARVRCKLFPRTLTVSRWPLHFQNAAKGCPARYDLSGLVKRSEPLGPIQRNAVDKLWIMAFCRQICNSLRP